MATKTFQGFGLFCVIFIVATLLGCDVPANDSADELSPYDTYEGDASYDTDPAMDILDTTEQDDTIDPCTKVLYLEQSLWICAETMVCILTFVTEGNACILGCWEGEGYGFLWQDPITEITWSPSIEDASKFYTSGISAGCTLASCPGCADEE